MKCVLASCWRLSANATSSGHPPPATEQHHSQRMRGLNTTTEQRSEVGKRGRGTHPAAAEQQRPRAQPTGKPDTHLSVESKRSTTHSTVASRTRRRGLIMSLFDFLFPTRRATLSLRTSPRTLEHPLTDARQSQARQDRSTRSSTALPGITTSHRGQSVFVDFVRLKTKRRI